ncbi:MAG: ThiF family adenylyltransferase [Candidatus Hadarchaeum sp.]
MEKKKTVELVLFWEEARRLLELEAQARPAFLSLRVVQGRTKKRVIAQGVSGADPEDVQGEWVRIPSVFGFLSAFDVIKIYAARGVRVLFLGGQRIDSSYRRQFRRVLDTYGWRDPMPYLSATVVGLGRLGSHVACCLSAQGIRRLVLIDPQTVERPNQQLIFYRNASIGTPKVSALTPFLRGTEVVPLQKALQDLTEEEWKQVVDTDAIFVCVDSSLPRILACVQAMRVGLPLFEGGVHIERRDGQVIALLGRVQTALPGFWCFLTFLKAWICKAHGRS